MPMPVFWNAERDALLQMGYLSGLTYKRIGDSLGGCSPKSVQLRILKLGIHGKRVLVKTPSPWNADLENRLRIMWCEIGMTSAQIGIEFGMTRNAIIGKAGRLGLRPKQRPGVKKKLLGPPRAYKPRRNRMVTVRKINTQVATKVITSPPIVPRDILENKPGIGIMSLNSATCRAIIGRGQDGLATYCGEQVADGKPFCHSHAVLFYQPIEIRRR